MLTRRTLTLGAAAGGAFAALGANAHAQAARFPLSIEGRHLREASGAPFLLHGDTAWSLIAQLRREDALIYLNDRAQRGFNAVLINVIEHHFAAHPPANAYGQAPFRHGRFDGFNEAYFAHAEFVIRAAAERGMLVLLAPCYLGTRGSEEGFYHDMVAGGVERLHAYGQYLGRRFSAHRNILWVHGGDYNPPSKDGVRAIVDGIRETDTLSLHTVHCGDGTSALDYWDGEPWLQLNNVYSYDPIYEPALQAARHDMPFFLMESDYENEHDASVVRLRTQAYHALLSGGCGTVFGNSPIWHFSTPGMANGDWREALDSPGARSMTTLKTLFGQLDWPALTPDHDNTLLIGGHGEGQARAVAASSETMALIYTPGVRALTVRLDRFEGSLHARWCDVAGGACVPTTPAPGEGVRVFTPPGRNAGGEGDWLLMLRVAA